MAWLTFRQRQRFLAAREQPDALAPAGIIASNSGSETSEPMPFKA
jgi:hypothetical protein